MKKISKIITILGIMALSITGCGKATTTEKNIKKIGIIQPVSHESLDNLRKGFIEKLEEEGFKEGENIEIDYQNANGDQSNNNTIADKFVNEKKDLILAIGTPAAQSVANKTKDIPVLFAAVTNPEAAGLVKSNNDVGGNVTGTSDKVSVEKQLELLFEVKPIIKKVGLLYSSSEDNSLFSIDEAKKILDTRGISYIDLTVQNTNDIQSVLENNIDKVDAIYIPTDNIIASSMPTVYKINESKKLPIVTGALEMMQGGSVAGIGVDYKTLGKQTGEMAIKILKGEVNPDKLPVEIQKKFIREVNEDIIKKFNLTLPKGE